MRSLINDALAGPQHSSAANQTFLAGGRYDLSVADLQKYMDDAFGKAARLFHVLPVSVNEDLRRAAKGFLQ